MRCCGLLATLLFVLSTSHATAAEVPGSDEPTPDHSQTGLVEIGFPLSTISYTYTYWDHGSVGATFRTNLLAASILGVHGALHLLPPRTLGVDIGVAVTVGASTRSFDSFPLVIAPSLYVQWAAFDELLVLGLEYEHIGTIPNPGDSIWAFPKLVHLYIAHKFGPRLYGRVSAGILNAQSGRTLSCEGPWDELYGPRPTGACTTEQAIYDTSLSVTVGISVAF
jgi:hypothetical protein